MIKLKMWPKIGQSILIKCDLKIGLVRIKRVAYDRISQD